MKENDAEYEVTEWVPNNDGTAAIQRQERTLSGFIEVDGAKTLDLMLYFGPKGRQQSVTFHLTSRQARQVAYNMLALACQTEYWEERSHDHHS